MQFCSLRLCPAILSSCSFYVYVMHELWNLPSNEVNFANMKRNYAFKKYCLIFRGHASTKKRFWIEVVIGYFIPALITLFTYLTATFSEKCSMFNPRFGEQTCFFSGIFSFCLSSLFSLTIFLHSFPSQFLFSILPTYLQHI